MNTSPNGDLGEHFNVRNVHGAIMREYKLPGENYFRISWKLKLFYHVLAIIAILYAVDHATGWDWEQYDFDPTTASEHPRSPISGKK
jgi:hypothetical protein